MPAKFVVKRGTTGKFRFSLLAPNGQVVASSQTYETKAACMNGLRSVQRNAAGATVDDLTVVRPAAKPVAVAKKAAPPKPAAKKAAAQKPAARKPAAKRTAARKRA